MLAPTQGMQVDRTVIMYALGSIAALAMVLKNTIFRGSKPSTSAPAAQKSSVKDVLAENPLLLQVALAQGIPLSDLVAESGQDAEVKDTTEGAPIEGESLPPAADAISIYEHPAVKKAEKRMHKSRLLRKMDEDVKELMRQVVYLGAISQP